MRLLEKQTDTFRQLIDTLELVLKEGVTAATTEQAEQTLAHMREHSMAPNQF